MKVENQYYNEDIKQKFIESANNDVAKQIYVYPLRKAKTIEKNIGKDLYDMTLQEIEEVVSSLSCGSETAVYGNVLIIEKYIEWAIENGHRKSNISPLAQVNKPQWSKGFVATYKNYYFTREHVIDMTDQLVNESDRALLLGLFEGIRGTGFSELLNLEEKDIREKDGIFQVRLNGNERTIEISERLAQMLISAANRPEYINKNGGFVSAKKYETSSFEDSPKIFKKTKKGKNNDEGLDVHFVNRRFVMFKKLFGHKHLKTKHIFDSGIMHMANELQEDGVLSSENARKIADKFNTSMTSSGNSEKYRNLTIIKKIIEMNEFEELYGYKIKL